jgi:N4-gp56 family major capsid protein
MTTLYGDISPRTAIMAAKKFLENGIPYVVTEPFCQADTIPKNASDTMVWRRYLPLDPTPAPLTENVTPNAAQLTHEDVQATLQQYYGGIQLSDKVMDMHEDPVLQRGVKLLGQQGAEMAELIRLGIFVAGSQVLYSGAAAARNQVAATLSLNLQRNATRLLERNRAKKFTDVIRSTASFGTQNIPRCYIAWVHPDLEPVIEDLAGFKHYVDYGQLTPFDNEIGSVGPVRYLKTDLLSPFRDSGNAIGGDGMISTTGVRNDVYPVLYIAKDALGTVALKGGEVKNNNGKMEPVVPVSIMVTNAKPSDSDPWAQRNWATYKYYLTAAILQDLWMVRAEVACPA